MENDFKFKGQKFERNLSFHEFAKMFGTSNVKLLELLRSQNILFKQGNRNIPYDKFLMKGWFDVRMIKIDNENFVGMVPAVKITEKGFYEIESLLIQNNEFIKQHNYNTFFKTIKLITFQKFSDLGINTISEINKNLVTHTDENGLVTLFTFINKERINIISYNPKNKKIIKHA